MKYVFAAERKLIFFISAGGKNRLVEFGDRNRDGASSYMTNETSVARAIRRTSLFKRGIIVQADGPTEEEENAAQQMMAPKRPSMASVFRQAHPAVKPGASQKPGSRPVEHAAVPQQPTDKVMEFPNITFAREALAKQLDIPKSRLRTQAALDKAARDNGIIIKYSAA